MILVLTKEDVDGLWLAEDNCVGESRPPVLVTFVNLRRTYSKVMWIRTDVFQIRIKLYGQFCFRFWITYERLKQRIIYPQLIDMYIVDKLGSRNIGSDIPEHVCLRESPWVPACRHFWYILRGPWAIGLLPSLRAPETMAFSHFTFSRNPRKKVRCHMS